MASKIIFEQKNGKVPFTCLDNNVRKNLLDDFMDDFMDNFEDNFRCNFGYNFRTFSWTILDFFLENSATVSCDPSSSFL